MSVSHLRLLVILSFLLLVASYIAPVIEATDPIAASLLSVDGYRAVFASSRLYFIAPLVLLVACIGVSFLQNWGRYLYGAWVAFTVIGQFVFGYRVSSPVDEFLGSSGFVVDGAILAIVFLSPLRSQFGSPSSRG